MKSKRHLIRKALVWSLSRSSKKFAKKEVIRISNSHLINLIKQQKSITLFSIKPQYSKLIFSGKKKIELRKTLPKIKNRLIAVYETTPTKKIRGLCEISNYYEFPIRKINNFVKKARINKKFILSYYNNSNTFVAIEIAKTYSFKKAMSLQEFSKKKIVPPQSFSYINNFNLSLILSYL